MLYRDISFEDPKENLLFDELLLALAEEQKGAQTLRIWESPVPFVVLGRIGKAEDDVRIGEVKRDRIPVLRRASGGGTVLQGRGCLNFTLVLAKDFDPLLNDINKSYQFILGKVSSALCALGCECRVLPISDIATSSGRKISGNAQKRGRNYILHHGTILYDYDLDSIARYLRMPKEMPDYREGRGHDEFVTNCGLDPAEIRVSLRKAFGVIEEKNSVSENELNALKKMACERKVSVDI